MTILKFKKDPESRKKGKTTKNPRGFEGESMNTFI
tara:strand:- start:306 stop:410 length:105 start_codon:yes stop_codon:yes gene_type:complete